MNKVRDYNKGKKLKSHYTKHNDANHINRSRLYIVWQGIIQRCYNPKKDYYDRYGGRGIKVCDEWLPKNNGYIHFREWSILHGYNENECYPSGKNKLTIDRIDNNKGYEPSNCRWTTWSVQNKNKSKYKVR